MRFLVLCLLAVASVLSIVESSRADNGGSYTATGVCWTNGQPPGWAVPNASGSGHVTVYYVNPIGFQQVNFQFTAQAGGNFSTNVPIPAHAGMFDPQKG